MFTFTIIAEPVANLPHAHFEAMRNFLLFISSRVGVSLVRCLQHGNLERRMVLTAFVLSYSRGQGCFWHGDHMWCRQTVFSPDTMVHRSAGGRIVHGGCTAPAHSTHTTSKDNATKLVITPHQRTLRGVPRDPVRQHSSILTHFLVTALEILITENFHA